MICPDCEKGLVLILRGQSKEEARPYRGEMFLPNPEKYFDKVPCPRCNGSGIEYCHDAKIIEFNPPVRQGKRSGAGRNGAMFEGG